LLSKSIYFGAAGFLARGVRGLGAALATTLALTTRGLAGALARVAFGLAGAGAAAGVGSTTGADAGAGSTTGRGASTLYGAEFASSTFFLRIRTNARPAMITNAMMISMCISLRYRKHYLCDKNGAIKNPITIA
jgi:hypothetical protein